MTIKKVGKAENVMQELISNNNNKKDSFLVRLFRGDIDLWVTFWVFGVSVSIFYKLIITLLIVNSQAVLEVGGRGLFIIVLLVGLVYQPFIWIAVWRSANKYKGFSLWAFLAKFSVILGIVSTILQIFAPR